MSLELDYEKVDPKHKRAVQSIEAKPHVRYIRYLMTKRYSPICIKKELQRLGLSAPHEPQLTAYYLSVIDPVIKDTGVSEVYSEYKGKMLVKGTKKRWVYAKEILNYRLNLGDELDLQVKFNKFVKELDIGELWMNEIYNFHGSAGKLPVDENGLRILNSTCTQRNVEKVLLCPKRYLIDKMILENIPDTRIAKHCREKLKLNMNDYDIGHYKRMFFNIKTQIVEDKIKALEIERNSLATLLKDINETNEYADLEMGEKMLLAKQTEQRLTELDDNIKTLNMMFSDYAFQVATSDQGDFEKMFADVTLRAYSRFTQLDGYRDRDVVDPLFKTAKMMSFAHDKFEAIRLVSGAGQLNSGNGDRHSQGVLIELYKKRLDEISKEQMDRANGELGANGEVPMTSDINYNDIDGIEELGMSFETEGNEEE